VGWGANLDGCMILADVLLFCSRDIWELQMEHCFKLGSLSLEGSVVSCVKRERLAERVGVLAVTDDSLANDRNRDEHYLNVN
jgi:hypothetical protein